MHGRRDTSPSHLSPVLSSLLDVLVNLAQTGLLEPSSGGKGHRSTYSKVSGRDETREKGNAMIKDIEAIQMPQDIFLKADNIELQAEVLNRLFKIFSSHLAANAQIWNEARRDVSRGVKQQVPISHAKGLPLMPRYGMKEASSPQVGCLDVDVADPCASGLLGAQGEADLEIVQHSACVPLKNQQAAGGALIGGSGFELGKNSSLGTAKGKICSYCSVNDAVQFVPADTQHAAVALISRGVDREGGLEVGVGEDFGMLQLSEEIEHQGFYVNQRCVAMEQGCEAATFKAHGLGECQLAAIHQVSECKIADPMGNPFLMESGVGKASQILLNLQEVEVLSEIKQASAGKSLALPP